MSVTHMTYRPRSTALLVALALAVVGIAANDQLVAHAPPDLAPHRVLLEDASASTNTDVASSTSSSSSSSSSATPTPTTKKPKTPFTLTSTPASSSVFVGTVAPEKVATFFGLFPTKTLYLSVGIFGPVAFLVYKLLLACWFCTAGRRKFAREEKERQERQQQEREEMEREAIAAQQAAALNAYVASSDGPEKLAKPPSTKANTNANNPTPPQNTFWIEEDLHAWRLDFQQLKTVKCLTATPNQRRHTTKGPGSPLPLTSEVWLATYFESNGSQRPVVLKWIPGKGTLNMELQQEKMKEEIRRQSKLRHPNVVAFVGIAWSPETNLVAVTDYMPRGDLRQWLHRTATKLTGRWTAVKVKMVLDVTNAIVYLHSFQPRLIHGNCNSRNVLLNDKMEAKLSDFGAPKDHLTEREINAYKEVGSGRWISPEALIGGGGDRSTAGGLSDAMDVYSLGILMVEMDTHELPFADLMHADRSQLPENDVLQLIASGALTPTLSSTCHPKIQQLVTACTEFNPQKRPSSREIARVLQAIHLEFTSASAGTSAMV